MSNDQVIEDQIQAKGLTAPRITKDHIDSLQERLFYEFNVIGTSTFCHAFLDNRFLLATGHSACVSLENFDEQVGRDIAQSNAREQAGKRLWELEGYRLYMQLNEEPPI